MTLVRPADQTTVRRANLGVVLRHVAEHGPCSRAHVAAESGLTRGTVSSLVAELIELELLRETGLQAGPRSVGRPGRALELADTVAAVGLEVNVDYLAVCIEDLTGTVRYERRAYGDNRGSAPGPVLDRLTRMARSAVDAAAAAGMRPVGLGLALPGIVEVASGMLLRAPNLDWTQLPAADGLCERLGTTLPIRVENEANLAALAEHWSGAARTVDSFLCVFGEVGVGAGILVGGELYRGSQGFGGELGHVTVDPFGAPCACGSSGCLETLVGQEAIARRVGVEVAGSRTRSLTEELVRRASARDERALAALREAGSVLGSALASTVNLFDLDAVVLGGCFGPLAPWIAGEVRSALDEHVLSSHWSTCDVIASAFGEGAAVRGAAAVVLRGILFDPWLAHDLRSASAARHVDGELPARSERRSRQPRAVDRA